MKVSSVDLINRDIDRGPLRNSNLRLRYELGSVSLNDLYHESTWEVVRKIRGTVYFRIVKYF